MERRREFRWQKKINFDDPCVSCVYRTQLNDANEVLVTRMLPATFGHTSDEVT
jgi:hypothetical protein